MYTVDLSCLWLCVYVCVWVNVCVCVCVLMHISSVYILMPPHLAWGGVGVEEMADLPHGPHKAYTILMVNTRTWSSQPTLQNYCSDKKYLDLLQDAAKFAGAEKQSC